MKSFVKKRFSVFTIFRTYNESELGISSITLAEPNFGVNKSMDSKINRQALAEFCVPIAIFPFNKRAARNYGVIRADLERVGTPIGPLDLLIASRALSLGVPIVTNNKKEFRRVPGLKVENWL